MEVHNYGPTTNGTGTGILGTAAATLMNVPCNGTAVNSQPYYISSNPSKQNQYTYTLGSFNTSNKPLNEILDEYQKDIKTLKDENELLKNKVEVLEFQFKFALNKLAEMGKLLENKND